MNGSNNIIVYGSQTQKNQDEFIQELAKHPMGCTIALVVFIIGAAIAMWLQNRQRRY